MLIIAVCPWQVFSSRWGLESNLLPSVILLGLLALQNALGRHRNSTLFVIFALLPMTFALYAYGIFAVPLAVFALLVVARHYRAFRTSIGAWTASILVALAVATPFLIFMYKNYVYHGWLLPLENWIPFKVPLLTVNRLDEVSGEGSPVAANLALVLRGFDDGAPWNVVPGHAALPQILILFGLGELCFILVRALRVRTLRCFTLIDLLLISSFSLLVLLPFDLNQASPLVLALALSSAKGLSRTIDLARGAIMSAVVATILVGSIVLPCALSVIEYVSPAQVAARAETFTPGAGDAIRLAAALSPNQPVWITPEIPLNYVQTLWYLRVPPNEFRASNPVFWNPDFGRYRFLSEDLATLRSFAFVVRSDEADPCDFPTSTMEHAGFRSGYCS